MHRNPVAFARVALLLGVGLTALPFSLTAQTAVDGAVGGTVTDLSGAVIARASVELKSKATNALLVVTTDSSGAFRAIHLQPGEYSLTVTASGFGSYTSTTLTVQVGELTDVSPKLQVGSASEIVSVDSELPIVNSTSPDFAQVINLEQLSNLPVNNYRWSSYALLTPGVVEGGGFGLLSFRGQSTLQNNVQVDGEDNNQAFFAEERGRTTVGYSLPKEAVQEFQVNTSNYTTEYGRAIGGVVNAITKSGSNTLHGEGYFIDRDSYFAAQNDFTSKSVQQVPGGPFIATKFKPTDIRKQMGLTIGGPLLRDKVFFFFALDDYYRDFPIVTVASAPATFFLTPNASLPAGLTCAGATAITAANDTNYAGDILGCNLQTNLALPTYAAGAADYSSGLAGLNSLLGQAPRFASQTIFLPKIDWQINSRNHASFEVNRLRFISPGGQQTNATASYGTQSVGNIYVRSTQGISKLDTVLSPNVANEVRYQYNRDFNFGRNQTPTAYENATLNNPSGYTNPTQIPPNVNITNGFQFGTPTFYNRPAYPDERRWQVSDTINWQIRNHSVKFGGDMIHTNDLSQNLTSVFGAYSYTSVLTYLTDYYQSKGTSLVPVATQRNNYSSYAQGFGPLGFEFQTKDYSGFVQDDWKVSSRLTLNLGLRYEYEQTPQTQLPNPYIPQTASLPSDKNNLSPRVGFAYGLTGDGKTVIRGGWGIFTGRLINSTIYNAIAQTGSSAGQSTPSFTPALGPRFPQLLPAIAGSVTQTAYFFDPGFQLPSTQQFDLALQREIGWKTVLSISYLGALGRSLPDFVDTNLPAPTTATFTVANGTAANPLLANGATYSMPFYTGTRPDTRYSTKTLIFSGPTSSYNALVVQVQHDLYKHLSFQGSYTWSHALDYGENNTTFTNSNSLVDPNNLHGEYGNSNQNVPSRGIITATLESPFKASGFRKLLVEGYQLSPSFTAQSGEPLTPAISGSATGGTTTGFNGSNGSTRLPLFERNSFRLPSDVIMDLRGSKKLNFAEHYSIELWADGFNMINRQNITAENTTSYAVSTVTAGSRYTLTANSTPFGSVTNSNNNNIYLPRQIQLGARLIF